MRVDYNNLPVGTVSTPPVTGAAVRAAQGSAGGPRHLAHPLRLVDGPGGSKVFATLEQDTLEEVSQSLRILLSTEVGERYRDAPDYGVDELLTGNPVNTAQAATAVQQFEPRAKVTFSPGPVDSQGQTVVLVNVTLVEGAADVTPSLDR